MRSPELLVATDLSRRLVGTRSRLPGVCIPKNYPPLTYITRDFFAAITRPTSVLYRRPGRSKLIAASGADTKHTLQHNKPLPFRRLPVTQQADQQTFRLNSEQTLVE